MMKRTLYSLLFPKRCLGCNKYGEYLCLDCLSTIPLSSQAVEAKNLDLLYSATDYNNPLVRKIIGKYKYKPFAKDLAKSLALIIIAHLKNMEKKPSFLKNKEVTVMVPIPLSPKRLKWRGFNQAEEVAKIVAAYYELPLLSPLTKEEREPQAELNKEKRENNILGSISCSNPDLIKKKRIVLFDDVYTTGATMAEGAKVLRENGGEKICGLVVARG